MISAVVLTKNEEKNLETCLKSLQWCDELIVIDDNSEDKTREIATSLGAKVFKHSLKANFSQQRNFALTKVKHPWVLFVDADEEISSELKKEIIQLIKSKPRQNGFNFHRQDFLLGKRLRFGETAKVKLLRLARKEAGKWQGQVHEVWQIKGEAGELTNPLLHQRKITIGQFLERINRYSSVRAKELYEKKVHSNWLTILAYPVAKFLQNFFFRLGFLDGQVGFVMATMMSIHSFLVRAKLYLLWQNKGQKEFPIPSMEEINKRYG